MKFSGKMYIMIILKVTKKQSFTLSLEDTFFKKPQGELKLIPPVVLGLTDQVDLRKLLLYFYEIKNYTLWLVFLLMFFRKG